MPNPVHGLDPCASDLVIRNGKYGIKWFDGLQIPNKFCDNNEDDTLDSGLDVYSSTDESHKSDED